MLRVTSKPSDYGLLGFICLLLGACSQGQSNVAQETSGAQVSSLESALENPVAQCEQDQATCLGAASDRAGVAACSESFRACLGGAAEMGQQLATTLEQCRETAVQCAVQGGATGADACRSDYDACVTAATAGDPQPSAAGSAAPGLPQLPQLPAAGSSAPRLPTAGGLGLPGRRLPFAGAGGIGSLPTRPGFPRLPGAGSVSLPSAAGRGGLPGRRPGTESTACFETLRTCAEAPNADLNQCATAARACVRGDSAPGGDTGAAGAAGAP